MAKTTTKPKPAAKLKAVAKAKVEAKSKTVAKTKAVAKTTAKAKPATKPKTVAKPKPTTSKVKQATTVKAKSVAICEKEQRRQSEIKRIKKLIVKSLILYHKYSNFTYESWSGCYDTYCKRQNSLLKQYNSFNDEVNNEIRIFRWEFNGWGQDYDFEDYRVNLREKISQDKIRRGGSIDIDDIKKLAGIK